MNLVFSRCLQNFTIFTHKNEPCLFMRTSHVCSWKRAMFMKMSHVCSWFLHISFFICPFSCSSRYLIFLPIIMDFSKLNNYRPLSWISQSFFYFANFLEFVKISWVSPTFMKLAKFHHFWPFFGKFGSWQNLMIFAHFCEVPKI